MPSHPAPNSSDTEPRAEGWPGRQSELIYTHRGVSWGGGAALLSPTITFHKPGFLKKAKRQRQMMCVIHGGDA